jgi:hypothetical protein
MPVRALSFSVRVSTASPGCAHAGAGQYHCSQAGVRRDGVDHCSECCGGSHRECGCPCAEHGRYGVVSIAQPYRACGLDWKGRRETAQRDRYARHHQQRSRGACIDPPNLRCRWTYGVGAGDMAGRRKRVVQLVQLHVGCPCLQFTPCGRACDHTSTDAGWDHALCGSGWNCDHGGDSLDSLRHRVCSGDGPAKRPASCLGDRQLEYGVSAAAFIPVVAARDPHCSGGTIATPRTSRPLR